MAIIDPLQDLSQTTEEGLVSVYDCSQNGQWLHYHQPVCRCGWKGEPRYFGGYAQNDLAEHKAAAHPGECEPRLRRLFRDAAAPAETGTAREAGEAAD